MSGVDSFDGYREQHFRNELLPRPEAHDGYTDADLARFGWSPGHYEGRCRDCRERAIGEKLSGDTLTPSGDRARRPDGAGSPTPGVRLT